MARRRPAFGVFSAAEWRARHLPGRPGKIAGDPAVRAFIDARLPTTTFTKLAAAGRDGSGADRAPSRSAIHRYWLRTLAGTRGPIPS